MDIISKFINTYSPNLSENSRNIFQSFIVPKSFKKGEILVNAGDISAKFFVLKNGLLRNYIVNSKGKEFTRKIYTPITTAGSTSLFTKEPSDSILECLIDSEILVGDFNAFIKSTEEHHDLSLFYNRVIENIFLRTEKKVYDLSILNATERYLKLKKEIPNIENLIPQYQIASYLNVSAVQLSRIRREIYNK